MSGASIGTRLHGPPETVLTARFTVVRQDGTHSLRKELIDGDDALVQELEKLLAQIIAARNAT
jgi:hypothetical protein